MDQVHLNTIAEACKAEGYCDWHMQMHIRMCGQHEHDLARHSTMTATIMLRSEHKARPVSRESTRCFGKCNGKWRRRCVKGGVVQAGPFDQKVLEVRRSSLRYVTDVPCPPSPRTFP